MLSKGTSVEISIVPWDNGFPSPKTPDPGRIYVLDLSGSGRVQAAVEWATENKVERRVALVTKAKGQQQKKLRAAGFKVINMPQGFKEASDKDRVRMLKAILPASVGPAITPSLPIEEEDTAKYEAALRDAGFSAAVVGSTTVWSRPVSSGVIEAVRSLGSKRSS
jgi:hypothetical protein